MSRLNQDEINVRITSDSENVHIFAQVELSRRPFPTHRHIHRGPTSCNRSYSYALPNLIRYIPCSGGCSPYYPQNTCSSLPQSYDDYPKRRVAGVPTRAEFQDKWVRLAGVLGRLFMHLEIETLKRFGLHCRGVLESNRARSSSRDIIVT
jgi:hypothetical protein